MDPIRAQPTAFVSSFLSAARSPHTSFISSFPPGFQEALRVLSVFCPALCQDLLPLVNSLPSALDHPSIRTWCSQKAWHDEMKDSLTSLFSSDADARTANLRTLNATPFSSQWLVEPLASDLPSLNELSSSEWQDLLRYRLGLHVMQDSLCRACSGHSDSVGYHALSCASCGRYAPHNAPKRSLGRRTS